MAKSAKKNVKASKRSARRTPAKAKKAAPKKVAPKKAAPTPPKPHTLTPYLAVNDAAAAVEWYKKAFGAKERNRQMAGDKIMHAALAIGDSDLFLADIFPGSDIQDASRVGPSVTIHVYTKNIDKLWQSAVANGAKVTMPLDNMFWGDRYGQLRDPFGHAWAFNYPAKMTAAEKEAKRVEAMKQMGAP